MMTGNVIADLVGFIAAAIGGFVFREELTVSAAFTQEFLGKWWDVGIKWYRHSVARGVRNVLAFEFVTSSLLFTAWVLVASFSGVMMESAWWLLPFGVAVAVALLPNLAAMLSFAGVGALDLPWFVRQVQAVQAAEDLVEALRRSAEDRRLNNNGLRYFNERLLAARSLLNRLRAARARRQSALSPARQTTMIARILRLERIVAGLNDIVSTWNEQDETGAEFTDSMHSIVLDHFESRRVGAALRGNAFEINVRDRSGARAAHVVLPSLVAILAPQVAGLLLLLASVLLVGFNGLNWFTFFFLGITSFLVYLQGEVALNLVSTVVVKVLVDGGDVFNRLLNSILIRPGLEVLPGITTENYDKVVGGDINVPFKAVGEAARKSTGRLSLVIHRIFGWTLVLPSIYTFGFVTLSGWYVPYMSALHKHADLDEKPFLKNIARAEIATKYTGYAIRVVQFFLAACGIMLEPSLLWNSFAGWANTLIDVGVLSWTMAGLVIVGAVGASYFMGKHEEAKTKVAKYPLLALASAFALLAILPLAGWLGRNGGVELEVPSVPRSTVRAEAPEAAPPPPPHEPDAIDRMTGTGTVVTPAPSPTPVVAPSAAPAVSPVERASAPTAPADVCDQIAHAAGLTDLFRDSMRRRHGCDG